MGWAFLCCIVLQLNKSFLYLVLMSISSFLDPKEKRYRLREENKVVGYAKEVFGGARFFSKDGAWWSGREIGYNKIDEWVGLKDRNGKFIFEWDIVSFKVDPDEKEYRRGAILWEKQNKRFGIRQLDEEIFIPLQVEGMDLFKTGQIKVISFLFINPDIAKELGLEE